MVCDAGMKNRAGLKAATNGTGPYVLTEAVPSDHYTYQLREGYTWGPGGATTAEKGMPAKVVVKIVANETTAANELLAGTVNAVQVIGPDADRLAGAGLKSVGTQALVGLQWYNHAEGHPTSDPAVRMALTQAVDLKQLQVAITSGKGAPATQFATLAPSGCTGDAVTGHLPAFDAAAAGAALDAAGWAKGADGVRAKDGKPLSVSLLYDSGLGSAGSAAAELAVAAWKAVGIEAKAVAAEPDPALRRDLRHRRLGRRLGAAQRQHPRPDHAVPVRPDRAEGHQLRRHRQRRLHSPPPPRRWARPAPRAAPTGSPPSRRSTRPPTWCPSPTAWSPTFVKGAELSIVGSIVPTSIRMLG